MKKVGYMFLEKLEPMTLGYLILELTFGRIGNDLFISLFTIVKQMKLNLSLMAVKRFLVVGVGGKIPSDR